MDRKRDIAHPRGFSPKRYFYKNAVIPFAYFLTLAFGLLFICIYLLTAPGAPQVIEAEEPTDETSEIDVNLIIDEDISFDLFEDGVVNELAHKIDAYFASNNAPLAGYGKHFILEARRNNIDPLIVASIAQCESSGGKVTPQFGNSETYNAWGYGVFDNNLATRAMNAYDMESWENGIALMSRAIKKYYERGLISPEEIVTRYTPASVRKANGDPTQAPWTLCVSGTMEKILGKELQLASKP